MDWVLLEVRYCLGGLECVVLVWIFGHLVLVWFLGCLECVWVWILVGYGIGLGLRGSGINLGHRGLVLVPVSPSLMGLVLV